MHEREFSTPLGFKFCVECNKQSLIELQCFRYHQVTLQAIFNEPCRQSAAKMLNEFKNYSFKKTAKLCGPCKIKQVKNPS